MPRTKPSARTGPRKPSLSIAEILRWADAYRKENGRWPRYDDGSVIGVFNQTWAGADQALRAGHRGLPGGSSLAKLLLARRGRRHHHLPPPLTVPRILALADAHHRRTGLWPGRHVTEPITNAPKGLTWAAIELAVVRGKRGLQGGVSLAGLLEKHRGVRNRMTVPNLSERQILAWADEHFDRTGVWPRYTSGPLHAASGETWGGADTALFRGTRGLPGSDSLARLLLRHRGVRNRGALPSLTVEQILSWASAHRKRTGLWPRVKEGAIPEAPGETWGGVNQALYAGQRGFPVGSSLDLLIRKRTRTDAATTPTSRKPKVAKHEF